MGQSYTDLDEENFENNSEPWAHGLDLCKTMSEYTCLEVCKFTKKKKKQNKKEEEGMLALLFLHLYLEKYDAKGDIS